MASAASNNAANGGAAAAAPKPKVQVWKTPSVAHQQKYFLQPLPEDFEPTEEEQALLKFYDTIRNYERQAARLKDAAARARLAAKDEEFQRQQKLQGNSSDEDDEDNNNDGTGEPAKKRARKRKKKKKPMSALDDDGEMDSDEDDDDDDDDDDSLASSDEDDTGKSSYDRREKKLQALRDEVEEKMSKKQKAEMEEEAKRRELLAEADDMDADGPSLRRKRVDSDDMDGKPKSSLIANLSGQATPPHDFSKKLSLTAMSGQKLFPPPDLVSWAPSKDAMSPDDRALTLELSKFDVSQAQNGMGNNTVAIKFMAPEESKRFSINIAGPDHDNFHSVLFHFNPRHYERGGQLVLNNKQEGIWGSAINVPLSQIPLIFGQPSCTIIIQINGEGFDVFLNDEKSHIARLEHRRALATGNISLFLNFPATDDYNKPENWLVYKVWWGNKPSLAKPDLTGVPGYKSFNSLHPRKLFISKLKKIRKDADVDLRKAEFERAFRKYGGARGVTVLAPKNQTFAFVEFESERMADLALQEMAVYYKINRARRTKHEALQEERIAAEKSGGKKKESTDWD